LGTKKPGITAPCTVAPCRRAGGALTTNTTNRSIQTGQYSCSSHREPPQNAAHAHVSQRFASPSSLDSHDGPRMTSGSGATASAEGGTGAARRGDKRGLAERPRVLAPASRPARQQATGRLTPLHDTARRDGRRRGRCHHPGEGAHSRVDPPPGRAGGVVVIHSLPIYDAGKHVDGRSPSEVCELARAPRKTRSATPGAGHPGAGSSHRRRLGAPPLGRTAGRRRVPRSPGGKAGAGAEERPCRSKRATIARGTEVPLGGES